MDRGWMDECECCHKQVGLSSAISHRNDNHRNDTSSLCYRLYICWNYSFTTCHVEKLPQPTNLTLYIPLSILYFLSFSYNKIEHHNQYQRPNQVQKKKNNNTNKFNDHNTPFFKVIALNTNSYKENKIVRSK